MIHPKTLLISHHFYSLESYVWRSIYNLNIDTISTYYIPLDRSFLKLWNGIRHVTPSTDRRLELKEKTSMAQNAWQAFVYANGLTNYVKLVTNICFRLLLQCCWGLCSSWTTSNMTSHPRWRLQMWYIYKPSTYFSDYNGNLLLLNSVFLHT